MGMETRLPYLSGVLTSCPEISIGDAPGLDDEAPAGDGDDVTEAAGAEG